MLADIYAVLGFIVGLLGLKSKKKQFQELASNLRADAERLTEQRIREFSERQQRERQKFFNQPELNTQNWKLHKQRLMQCRASRYDHCSNYVGPRGGVHYINSRGRKSYC